MSIIRTVTNDTVSGGATTTGTITLPTGLGANDISIILAYEQLSAGSLGATNPTGWTAIPGFTFPIAGSGNGGMVGWYKIGAGSGDVVTWPWIATGLSWGAIALAYRGVSNTTPFGSVASAGSVSTGLNPTVPAVTTTAADSEVVAVTGIGSSATTFTVTPTGYTRWPVENATSKRVAAADQAIAVSGSSSGATSWTTSATVVWVSVVFELLAAPYVETGPGRKGMF